jgi:hypothetical protein
MTDVSEQMSEYREQMTDVREQMSEVIWFPASFLRQFNIDNTGPSTYKNFYYDRHIVFVKYFYEATQSIRSEYGF